MKKLLFPLFMLSLLGSIESFAIGEGVAAGGGGGDQVPVLNVQNPDMVLITCPGQTEKKCSSQSCESAIQAKDEFAREQFLQDACAELKSE